MNHHTVTTVCAVIGVAMILIGLITAFVVLVVGIVKPQ
jgi:hypothetical protein